MSFALRPYQAAAVEGVRNAIRAGHRRIVLVSPTGSGKTEMGFEIVRGAVAKGKRLGFVANRINLVEQTSRRMSRAALEHGIVQGQNSRREYMGLLVCSIQTLARRRALENIGNFDVLVVDEAHTSAGSKDYRDLISKHSDKIVIGLTATPFSKGMGRVIDGLGPLWQTQVVAANYSELIGMGFLVDCDVYAPSEPDMRPYKARRNAAGELDYSDEDAGAAMSTPKLVGDIVEHWKRLANGKPTVCFASTIAHSKLIVERFAAAGVKAEHIDCYSSDEDRRAAIGRIETGESTIISNVGILCLDEETEVLTSTGWVGADGMTMSHEVANWDGGAVHFERPLDIFRRPRADAEEVFVLGGGESVRVTKGHDIVSRSGPRAAWKKRKVETLDGLAFTMPVSGYAKPFRSAPRGKPDANHNRLVVQRSHYLRKNCGYEYERSVAEARRRVERKLSLCRAAANDLSPAQCELIGLFHADGCLQKLQSGGAQYSFSQASSQPLMVEKFDAVFAAAGYHVVKSNKGNHFLWRLCRGTGGGHQERLGVFDLEPYLIKRDLGFLWELDESQFDSFVRGLWLGDGNHGHHGTLPSGHGMRLYQADKGVLDAIQAVASVRGYKTNLRGRRNGIGHYLWTLSLRKCLTHAVAARHSYRKESVWRAENVWCVKVTSGKIITRRRGSVAVIGNCEGWDFPACEVMILARPTRSLIRYLQMGGRILRPSPGKERAIILDHSGTVTRLGFPTDDREYELDDGKPKSSSGADEEPKLVACPKCGHVDRALKNPCPKCGHKREFKLKAEREASGELKKLERKKGHVDRHTMQHWYSGLLSICRDRGYNEGWVARKYKEKFGVWPKGMSRHPIDPSPEVRSWVLSQQIRYAQGRKASRIRDLPPGGKARELLRAYR